MNPQPFSTPSVLRSGLALFLVSFATLTLELVLSRVLSVSLWHHFAFLIISTAVLGFGMAGVVLTTEPRWLCRANLSTELAGAAGLMILVGLPILNRIPFDPFSLSRDPTQALWAIPFMILIVAPFFFAGLLVGGTLSFRSSEASRLYALDLIGAGLGAAAAPWVFGVFGGMGSLLVTAAPCFAAAALVSVSRRSSWVSATLAIATVVVSFRADSLAPIRITENKRVGALPIERVLSDPRRVLHSEWNSVSKIDLVRLGDGAQSALYIWIDGGVAWVRVPIVRAPINSLPPTRDISALAFSGSATSAPSVLIVGSGAGQEVLTALTHGAGNVTAVELNPGITALVEGKLDRYVGRIFRDPRVRQVRDEARGFLSRTTDMFDVMIAVHTISNAATAAGALTLSESYTLTAEAFDLYLSRLTDKGALLMTRPSSQMPRLFETARQALVRQGVADPSRHLAVFGARDGSEFMAVLVMGRSPLQERLNETASALGLETEYSSQTSSTSSVFSDLVAGRMTALELETGARLQPATDDRPFFHQRAQLSRIGWKDLELLFSAGGEGRGALEDAPLAEVSILVILVESILIAAFGLFWPLARKRSRPPISLLGTFAALGAGFMMVELGLVHRMSLLLGEPSIAFAVVVAGLLVSSGVGARISGQLDAKRALLPAMLLTGGLLLVWSELVGLVTQRAMFETMETRVLVAVLFVAPLGFALGFPFPLALRVAYRLDSSAVPTLFAANGFLSVVGGVMTVVVAMISGFASVMWVGAALYLTGAVFAFGARAESS